jgi:hypothetical protein
MSLDRLCITGSVNVGEALMRVYPEQDVGVVVMGSVVD